ncbi:aryl-alcohol dehydrogenase-like predicted oxidoreductase [Nonomuraea endophytica]|uniref:Aryl-alcohol dehydrogenase-like predicted oxidoreductase n=2 Tax=Nonomuraea endophytica TaxID=714136 RepID=A0A7W7ZYR8_9ACTN|nr:aryl-alcohol dehydrogenase-like predicted oxidoreductase [Nonomuraea endophytica]
MRLTGPGVWGPPSDREEALRVLRRAVELGVNLIDTADSYGPFVSEELIAEALHPYPEDLVIATKGGFTRQGPNAWAPLGRPEYLRQCVEMSLHRLKVERIDLYQLHRIDPQVPLADQLGELAALQKEGKIRHIGLSAVEVAEIEQARVLAEVVSVQNIYNLTRQRHRDVLEYCARESLAFIPYFPLQAGSLAGTGGELAELAKGYGASPSQIALAWLLALSPVTLPIPGTSRTAHLEENLAATGVRLTDEDVAHLTRQWSDEP